jgi:pimeloyl-ACP methyl ester carboxylesterase
LLPYLEPLLDSGGLQAVADALDQVAAADPRRATVPASVQAFLRRRFLANSPLALRTMAGELTGEPDRVGELAQLAERIGLPLLVAHGEHDDAWLPPVQAEMARRLGAEYGVIAGAYHSPAAERPTATADLLTAFFARVDAYRKGESADSRLPAV